MAVYFRLLCLFCMVDIGQATAPDNHMKLLYNNLFMNNTYNNKIRPQINWTETTYVNISMVVVNLNAYDEVSEQLSLTGKLTIEWFDEYLTWDPVNYGGLALLNVPEADVWRPDIALENSVTSYTDLGSSYMFVAVDNAGHVTWKPMKVFQSACSADVRHFPLDIQTCLLKFEVWSHPIDVVRMNVTHDYVKLHGYKGLPEWEITSTKAEMIVENGDVYAGFTITLTRKPLYLFLNVILPIAVISLLGQCVFLLPLDSGEKASFTVTILLSLVVFLTIVSQHLPNTSDSISIFNIFVFAQVLFCTFFTAITLLQLRLFYIDDNVHVPTCIQSAVTWKLPRCGKKRNHVKSNSFNSKQLKDHSVSITDVKEHPVDDENRGPNEIRDGHVSVTWRQVAIWMDLHAFILFMIMNAILIMCLVAL